MRPQSFEDIRDAVRRALQSAKPDASFYVQSCFPDSVVYEETGNLTEGPCKLYRRPYVFNDDGSVTFGDPVEVRSVSSFEPVISPAVFSIEEASGVQVDEFIERDAKIFEVGDYPDKNFSLSEAEADEAIAAFSPAKNNIEHRASIFANEKNSLLGCVQSIRREGTAIFGKVRLPVWLNQLFKDQPIKVSAEWTREPTKRMTGLALCLNPAIEDAAIFAAFTASTADPAEPRKGPVMTMKQKWTAFFSGLTEDDMKELDTDPAAAPADPAGIAAKDDEIARLKAELESRKAEGVAAEGARIDSAASDFTTAMIQAGKALPAEADTMKALFAKLAASGSDGKALFTESGALNESELLAAFKGFIEARPVFDVKGERLPTTPVGFIAAGAASAGDGEPTPERVEELLKMTPLGQTILAGKK